MQPNDLIPRDKKPVLVTGFLLSYTVCPTKADSRWNTTRINSIAVLVVFILIIAVVVGTFIPCVVL
ncbi:MAG: hypothetical protein ACRDBJ_03250, partial [Plesiomonas shigelloides]